MAAVLMKGAATAASLVMDRRRFLGASIVGLGLLTLGTGACSGSQPGGGGGRTLRLPQGALGFPSPFSANGEIGFNQTSLLYDTLMWKDGSGQLLPWLALSLATSADRLTYTFLLRNDVTWSDGRPFTADDVVFTFDYFAKQGTLSPPVILQPPKGIAKVSSPAESTVEITLTSPQVTFLEQVVGALPIIPRHVWSGVEDPGIRRDVGILVGTGPYRLESYDGDGGALLYTARDDYFLGAPYVRRIEMGSVDDAFAALRAGAVDVARGEGLRSDILAPFQNDEFGMITNQGSSAAALYWNLGKEGPLADVRFRRACAMAVDRQELVTRLAAGRGSPGNPGFLSPQNPFFSAVPQLEHDVVGAGALLDAAGYLEASKGAIRRAANGSPLSFEVVISNADAPLSEILVAALRRIGVELRPKQVQLGPQLFGNKLIGAYDIAVLPFPGPGPGSPNADPDILRLLFSSRVPASLQAATAYANPTFDELAEQQRVTSDEAQRKSIIARMQAILADDLPMLPLYYPETTLVFRKRVLDQWYFTPGQFPSSLDNKQLFITGMKSGTTIRS